MKTFKIFLVLIFIGFVSNSFASAYVRPKAGYFLPVDGGNGSYSLGLALGYNFFPMLSAEFSYEHLMGTGSANDGDLIKGEGIFHFPMAIISPYATGGLGTLHASVPGSDHWDTAILFGAGVDFTALPIVTLGVGFSYGIVENRPDFFEPAVTVGLSF